MSPIYEPWTELAFQLAERDVALKPLVEKIGPPQITLRKDQFRALAQAILSQQLATKAAATITERFRALAPPFPGPGDVLKMRGSKLRSVGVSGQKASYLKALSAQWVDPRWRRGWGKLSDEELTERLVAVKGIGEWTAHMFLIFSLGRPNILPVGDFGVRRGIQRLRGLKEMPDPKELPTLVTEWEGAYSVGAWYMWRGLEQKLLK